MVEEQVVKEVITDKMIDAGKQLTEALDDNPEITVSASLWLYSPENNTWSLLIASPQLHKLGPRRVYEIVLSALLPISAKFPFLSLGDIRVVSSDDPLIALLRLAAPTGEEVAGFRFNRNTIKGHYIEDSYIYRVN